MIWTTSKLAKTKRIEIIPRVQSDHNPIMWLGQNRIKQYRWCLNEDLFFCDEYTELIKEKTNHFFQINQKKKKRLQGTNNMGQL